MLALGARPELQGRLPPELLRGRIVVTAGIAALPKADNDPHDDDFGVVTVEEVRVFWVVDACRPILNDALPDCPTARLPDLP